MPRKPSTIAPAVRIRENQRRARARRKELIDDLQTKIRDCELQGVVATAEMQSAARKILLENRQLRALLAKKGVTAAEIEAVLRSNDHDASFTASLPTPGPADMIGSRGQAVPSANFQQPSEVHTLNALDKSISVASPLTMPIENGSERAGQTGSNSEDTGSSNDIELLQPGEPLEADLERESTLPNILGPVSDCYCPEIDAVPDHAQSLETECSVAANILASFRGHGDVQQARDELGCLNNTQCSITNAALLQTLDSEHANTVQPCNAPLR